MQTESHQSRLGGGKKPTKKSRIPAIKQTLNGRQLVAVRLLSRFSMLTYDHLALLIDGSRRTAERALGELLEMDLACCGGVMPEGYTIKQATRAMPVYSLSKGGVDYVEHHNCSDALFDRKPVARYWTEKLIADNEIWHKLGIVDCMVSLSKSVDMTGLKLSYLAPDFVMAEDGSSINAEAYDGGRLIPDVIASITNPDHGMSREFYIEYDRGTEDIWASAEQKKKARERARKADSKRTMTGVVPIADRFANYNTFFAGKGNKTSETNPTLLWVCETDEALRRIRESGRILWNKLPNVANRTLLATIDQVRGDFLRSNWHVPGSDEVMTVVELARKDRL